MRDATQRTGFFRQWYQCIKADGYNCGSRRPVILKSVVPESFERILNDKIFNHLGANNMVLAETFVLPT